MPFLPKRPFAWTISERNAMAYTRPIRRRNRERADECESGCHKPFRRARTSCTEIARAPGLNRGAVQRMVPPMEKMNVWTEGPPPKLVENDCVVKKSLVPMLL